MRGLFQQNLPLAQSVLRIVTGKPDLVLTRCETQADMKRVTGARSICLDAYGTDDSGKVYDLEIQRSDIGADPHRARYHSSVIDVENLDAGQEFRELPDTYMFDGMIDDPSTEAARQQTNTSLPCKQQEAGFFLLPFIFAEWCNVMLAWTSDGAVCQ